MTASTPSTSGRKYTTCNTCHIEFGYYGSRVRKFCSQKCSAEAKRIPGARIETKCPSCDVTFWYSRSWPRKFCSKKCAGQTTVINLGIHHRPDTDASRLCETCGTAINVWVRGKRFCSQACYGKWVSVTKRGPNHPRYGITTPTRPNTRVTIDCAICEVPFEVKKSHVSRRRCCSRACVREWQKGRSTGEKNGHWKGGHFPYYGPSWHPARRAVLARDGNRCQDCGKTVEENGRDLDVHHIKLFRTFGVERHEEANEISNLVALCFLCHTRRPEHRA